MPGECWTPQEVTAMISLYTANVAMVDIARKLGRSLSAVERKARDLKARKQILPRGSSFKGKAVEDNLPSYTNIERISEDTFNISDIHTPYQNWDLIRKGCALAKKRGIKICCIPGDFLNLDSFSRWVTGYRGNQNTEKELNSATALIDILLETFKTIYLSTGNHEDRLFRQLDGNITYGRYAKMFLNAHSEKRVVVSDYPYVKVKTFDGWCIVGHPKNYSDRGGQTPADLADTYDSHVICGHNHQWGIQISRNGKWMGVDHGSGADFNKIEYYNKSLVKNRKWQNGFSIIQDGHIEAFNLKFTDWNRVL